MSEVKSSSELTLRFRTGIPLAAVIALVVFAPTFVVGLVVLVLSFIGAQEFTNMLAGKEGKTNTTVSLPEWMLPVSAILMGLGALGGESVLHATLLISATGWIIFELVFKSNKDLSKLNCLGFGLFGMIWIIWSLSHMTLIKGLADGNALLFYLLFVISFSDICAYFGGKRYGKSMLAPSISPKKTWEGSFLGVLGGGFVGAVFGEIVISMFWLNGMLLAVVLAIVGQFGDLIESKIKRLCNVKDSGKILPGHGGILDRIDGHMLAAPAFYYLLKLG
tara:strand:- start:32 stop:862 length:831 start_codon:yes stop_codon:yes gene_type:complete